HPGRYLLDDLRRDHGFGDVGPEAGRPAAAEGKAADRRHALRQFAADDFGPRNEKAAQRAAFSLPCSPSSHTSGLSTFAISANSFGFAARILPVSRCSVPPSREPVSPPASWIISTPAAISHSCRFISQKPSSRPAAT